MVNFSKMYAVGQLKNLLLTFFIKLHHLLTWDRLILRLLIVILECHSDEPAEEESIFHTSRIPLVGMRDMTSWIRQNTLISPTQCITSFPNIYLTLLIASELSHARKRDSEAQLIGSPPEDFRDKHIRSDWYRSIHFTLTEHTLLINRALIIQSLCIQFLFTIFKIYQ